MGMMDRLGALGQGAGDTASMGWNDELAAKLLANIPMAGEEIPREYAGGSAENQYKQSFRDDKAQAQDKYPANYATGQVLGAAPAAIATGAAGGLPAVAAGTGLGALQGAGASEAGGMQLAKDAVKGGALGGATASAGNALAAGGSVLRDLMTPKGPNLAPAGVSVQNTGTSVQLPTKKNPVAAVNQTSREDYYDKFTQGFGKLKDQGKISESDYGQLADTSKKLAAAPRGQPVKSTQSIPPLSAEEQDQMLQQALNKGFKQKPLTNRQFVGEETGEKFMAPYSDDSAEKFLGTAKKAQEEPVEMGKTVRPGGKVRAR